MNAAALASSGSQMDPDDAPDVAPSPSGLQSGFSTSVLRDIARKELVDILDSIRGKKTLVIDSNLSGPLSLIAEFSLLKEHGVEKIFHLQPGPLASDSRSILYICRPTLSFAKIIAGHIKAARSSPGDSSAAIDFSAVFVPRKTLICERHLEEEGVLGDVSLGEYHLDLVPLEDDLLSLEVEGAYKELYLEGDTTSVYYLAKAIMKLQTLFGVIPRIVGKGTNAKLLADLLVNLRRELLANTANLAHGVSSSVFPAQPAIDSLIVLDRTVDLVTPLCTQLTYEGLIDEVFGIRSSFVEVDAAVLAATPATALSAPSGPARRRKVPLSSSDPLHSRLRDLNFAVVGGVLNEVARKVQSEYEGRHSARTVGEIRNFVGRLGGLREEHQSVALHTHLAELITTHTLTSSFNSSLEAQQNFVSGIAAQQHVDLIEDMIGRQDPVEEVLRLLCLYGMAVGGLKGKSYEAWRKEIVQTYGYNHVLTFHNLDKSSFLPKPEAPTTSGFPRILAGSSSVPSTAVSPLSTLRKPLRLIVDDVDDQNPQDMSYVFSGYAPASVRLLQLAVTGTVMGQQPLSGSSASNPALKGSKERTASATGQSGSILVNAGGTGEASQQPQSQPLRPIGWNGTEEVVKKIPGGPHFEEVQPSATRSSDVENSASTGKGKSGKKTTLVVFLGGCGYAEIAAVRFLGQMEEVQRDFVILTTDVINGRTLLDSLIHKRDS